MSPRPRPASGKAGGGRSGPPARRSPGPSSGSSGPPASRRTGGRTAPPGAAGGAAGAGRSSSGSSGPGASARPRRVRSDGTPPRPRRSGPPSGRDNTRDTDGVDGPKRTVRGLGGEQVEGRQAVRELLVAGRRKVKEVLVASDIDSAPILDDIVELADSRRVPIRQIGRGKLDTLTATSAAQGVMARAQQLPEHDYEELARRRRPTPAFLLALDGVTDPGNLGAVIRSAEGAGVTGVVLPRHRAAHVTPSVTKAAAGAIEYMPMALVGGLAAALIKLDELGVWIVGLDSEADQSLYDLPIADERICLVLGAEGAGLSRLVRQRCHAVVRIPAIGQLNSLNVAAAGAIACFEVARARAGKAKPAVVDTGS